MKINRVRQNVFPMLAALIWGTAFVAQSVGADYVEPFTFNTARSGVAFIFLLILCVVLRQVRRRDFDAAAQPRSGSRRDLILGGICCGVALTVATNLQQKGLETTTSGKAGFITALYIVIVPIAGIFLKKKAPRIIWLSVALAVAGLYCLCITEDLTISTGDFYVLLYSVPCDHGALRNRHAGYGASLSGGAFYVPVAYFVCGHLLQRRGIYAPDPGPEGLQPHGGVAAFEPGVRVCDPGRRTDPSRSDEREGVLRMRADAGGCGAGPAAGPHGEAAGAGCLRSQMTRRKRKSCNLPEIWYNGVTLILKKKEL